MNKNHRKPQKRSVDNIWKYVNYMYQIEDKSRTLSLTEIGKIVGLVIMTTDTVEKWKKIVPLKIEYIKKGPAVYLKLDNVADIRTTLKNMYLNLWGIDITAGTSVRKLIPIPTSTKVDRPGVNDSIQIGTTIKRDLKLQIAKVIYSTAAILKLNRNSDVRAVDIVMIVKLLREEFNIVLNNNDLVEIIKENTEEIKYNSITKTLYLVSDFSWNLLSKEYSLGKFKKSVLVRITTSLEDLKKLISLNCEIESPINQYDNIYCIEYDQTKKSMMELIKLFRTFRGPDKFLDIELSSIIAREILILDRRAFNSISFKIEEL